MFRRACFLLLDSTTYHGLIGMSVCTIISSLAREYSSHRKIDSRSIGESFHCRTGSLRRDLNRRSCSSSETENQYLRRMMPSSMSICSKMGVFLRNNECSCAVQNPIPFATPARLYQDL